MHTCAYTRSHNVPVPIPSDLNALQDLQNVHRAAERGPLVTLNAVRPSSPVTELQHAKEALDRGLLTQVVHPHDTQTHTNTHTHTHTHTQYNTFVGV